mmetsp:Transcript_22095/g.44325  ORF Transcript_22095/g.44325 Transcript_22095/m.44325 type:complete len:260 (-) Transcript_22095:369-1148(-)
MHWTCLFLFCSSHVCSYAVRGADRTAYCVRGLTLGQVCTCESERRGGPSPYSFERCETNGSEQRNARTSERYAPALLRQMESRIQVVEHGPFDPIGAPSAAVAPGARGLVHPSEVPPVPRRHEHEVVVSAGLLVRDAAVGDKGVVDGRHHEQGYLHVLEPLVAARVGVVRVDGGVVERLARQLRVDLADRARAEQPLKVELHSFALERDHGELFEDLDVLLDLRHQLSCQSPVVHHPAERLPKASVGHRHVKGAAHGGG